MEGHGRKLMESHVRSRKAMYDLGRCYNIMEIMEGHGNSWKEDHGRSWKVTESHGRIPWKVMVSQERSQKSMEGHAMYVKSWKVR